MMKMDTQPMDFLQSQGGMLSMMKTMDQRVVELQVLVQVPMTQTMIMIPEIWGRADELQVPKT